MRVILIATTMADARQCLLRWPVMPAHVTVITPASPNACRGRLADEVMATPQAEQYMDRETLARLVAVALPCVVTQ